MGTGVGVGANVRAVTALFGEEWIVAFVSGDGC